MRARWLKPEFFRDKKVAAGGPVAALVYQALWLLADDSGVAQADPEYIHAQLFFWWSAVGVPEVTGALRHLSRTGRVEFFQPGDDLFAQIVNFSKHQKIHKPSEFRNLPEISDLDPVVPEWCGTSEAPVGHSPPPRHRVTKTPSNQDTKTAPAALDMFETMWKRYPQRPNNSKAAALRAWKARRAANVPAEEMVAGVERYAAYVASQRVEPRFVKLASTFFGPDEHFRSDFASPEATNDPYEQARRILEQEAPRG